MINPILVLFGMGHGPGGSERACGSIFSITDFFQCFAVSNDAGEPSAYARMQRTQKQSNSFSISLSLIWFFGASGAQVLVDMYLLILLNIIFWRLRRPSFSGYVSTDLRYYIFFGACGAQNLVDMYLLIFLHIIFRRRRNLLKPWKRLEPSRSLGKIARCASGALHGAMERYYFSMMRIIFAGLCVGRSNRSLL